jgi:hypothetical protein
MEGLMIGEKEIAVVNNVMLLIKNCENESHVCGVGKLLISSQRVRFDSEISVWEEALSLIGVVAVSKGDEFGGPSLLFQVCAENSAFFWVIRMESMAQVQDLYSRLTFALDAFEAEAEVS